MFIVSDYHSNFSCGETLEEAYDNYQDEHYSSPDEDCLTWYEATEIKVERKVSFSVLKPEAPKSATKAPTKTADKK
jgi:hypothetical protein